MVILISVTNAYHLLPYKGIPQSDNQSLPFRGLADAIDMFLTKLENSKHDGSQKASLNNFYETIFYR